MNCPSNDRRASGIVTASCSFFDHISKYDKNIFEILDADDGGSYHMTMKIRRIGSSRCSRQSGRNLMPPKMRFADQRAKHEKV